MKKTKKNLGFTLVEVLIACFVIVVGVIASYIVIQQIFSQTFEASKRLTAVYLAQEGAEIARNIRDTGWIQDSGWGNNGLNVGYHEAEYLDFSLDSCGACDGTRDDFDRLSFLKKGSPFYSYSSGESSPYKRRITIERPAVGPNAGAIIVTVDVMWKQRRNFRQVTIQSFLYDWKGQ